MVLNYHSTNCTGWPIPAFIMVQRYEIFLKYPNICANNFVFYSLNNAKYIPYFYEAFQHFFQSLQKSVTRLRNKNSIALRKDNQKSPDTHASGLQSVHILHFKT